MAMMTSAYANKKLKKLKEDKEFWETKEQESCFYVAALDEEPVVPEYDFEEVAKNIADIDAQIVKIKHAINVMNCTNEITFGGVSMTIDAVLVRMAQLNKRKEVLDNLRKQQPKVRTGSISYSSGNTVPEYRYINYDLELIKDEYAKVDTEIAEMQIALDKYNQTVEFEIEI